MWPLDILFRGPVFGLWVGVLPPCDVFFAAGVVLPAGAVPEAAGAAGFVAAAASDDEDDDDAKLDADLTAADDDEDDDDDEEDDVEEEDGGGFDAAVWSVARFCASDGTWDFLFDLWNHILCVFSSLLSFSSSLFFSFSSSLLLFVFVFDFVLFFFSFPLTIKRDDETSFSLPFPLPLPSPRKATRRRKKKHKGADESAVQKQQTTKRRRTTKRMGNVNETLVRQQKEIADYKAQKDLEIGLQLQERQRRIEMAQEIARARERHTWCMTTLGASAVSLTIFVARRRYFPMIAVFPLGGLLAFMGVNYDTAFGSRIKIRYHREQQILEQQGGALHPSLPPVLSKEVQKPLQFARARDDLVRKVTASDSPPDLLPPS